MSKSPTSMRAPEPAAPVPGWRDTPGGPIKARLSAVEPDARAVAALARTQRVGQEGPLADQADAVPADAWHTLNARILREYLDPTIVSRHPDAALDELLHNGCLDAWLPEVRAMVGFGDGEWRHKDVWKHTKQVVWQSMPRLEVRWGALLHDIGKMKTRSVGPRGEVHFYGHSEVGAAMFRRKLSRRLGFEGALHERIHFLILHHLRASQYDGTWTDSAVRRFAKEMGPGLKDLFDLSRADITTKRPEKKKRGLRQISELSRRVRAIEALDARIPPLPKGLGSAIVETFQIPPSKRVGELRRQLEERCEQGELPGGQPVEFYVAWLRERATEFNLPT